MWKKKREEKALLKLMKEFNKNIINLKKQNEK